jgi:hypothetical protein
LTRVTKKEIGRTFKALEKFIRDRDEERLKAGDNTAMVAGGKFLITLTSHEIHTMLNLCFQALLCYRKRTTLALVKTPAICATASAVSSTWT